MTYKNINDLSEVIAAKIITELDTDDVVLKDTIEDIIYHHVQRYINETFQEKQHANIR